MFAREKLNTNFNNNLHICVGLDPDINKIPKHLLKLSNPILEFNRKIIEATKDISAAYKLNFAFYEKLGKSGLDILEQTLELIPENVLSIADAKRGDIGNTAKYYASSVFETMNFDSVTLAPYMGLDSIDPFSQYENKLMFILVLTSNKSAADFEKLRIEDGKFLYQKVLESVNRWNQKNNLGIVFGATQKSELEMNLETFNDLPVLLPGVGSQGGSLEDVVKLFSKSKKQSFLINSSRGIIYADDSENFADVARKVVLNYNSTIKNLKINFI